MELFSLGYYIVAWIFGLGLIIGSFLNVVIYRLHTGKSLNGHSHCLSCGHKLAWYELVPVFSYITLRGRCRVCRSFIPTRYLLVELGTGFLFVMSWLHAMSWGEFLLTCLLLSVLMVILVYDLYHMIVPDELALLEAIFAIGLVFVVGNSLSQLSISLFSGMLLFSFFAGLWVVSSGKWMGLGDAKLAFGLGVVVGLSNIFSLTVLSFWIGAIISLVLMLVASFMGYIHSTLNLGYFSRVRMKSEVPFAPFMIVAFLVVHFFDVDILSLVNYVLPHFTSSF